MRACVPRQKRRWAEGNARDEDRLIRHLFALMRCGRVEAARQLCADVGQPWRALSLGAGGGLGLIPLGARLPVCVRLCCNDHLSSVLQDFAEDLWRVQHQDCALKCASSAGARILALLAVLCGRHAKDPKRCSSQLPKHDHASQLLPSVGWST